MKEKTSEDSKVDVKADESNVKKISGLKAYLVSVQPYQD